MDKRIKGRWLALIDCQGGLLTSSNGHLQCSGSVWKCQLAGFPISTPPLALRSHSYSMCCADRWDLSLFWDVTQCRMVVTCPHPSLYNCVLECSWHSSWTAWSLKMGQKGCPETSVYNYQPTLRIIPEERRSRSLKSRCEYDAERTFDNFRTVCSIS
jgi:hypothetical protein